MTPICAFDIPETGPALDCDPSQPVGDVTYRWVHCDLSDPDLEPYLRPLTPTVAANALCQAETRPRADQLGGGILLNVRGANMNPGSDVDDMVSLRIWMTEDLIISVRLRKVFAVDDIRAQMASDPPRRAIDWLRKLTEGLTDRIEETSLSLDDLTGAAEEAMVEDAPLPIGLGETRVRILKLRRFLAPQRDALIRLAGLDLPWLDPVRPYLRETANRTLRAVEELEAARDRLSAVQDHFDAQAADRLGRNSYSLSIIAAIFLPLGFLTGLFGVNVAGMPGINWPWAFIVLCLASVGMGVLVWGIMRWLRWL